MVFEVLAALVDERAESALDYEVDEWLGRIEAAAVLAGVAIRSYFDATVIGADGFALQQAFVDRAKLLDGHVAVVYVAAAVVALGVAEVVDDGSELGFGEANLLEDGRGPRGEEAAVVGGRPIELSLGQLDRRGWRHGRSNWWPSQRNLCRWSCSRGFHRV